MNCKRKFKLLKDIPFLKKGTVFVMYASTGNVHWIDEGKETRYPLRTGLAGYLWLLTTEKRIMKCIESKWEND